MSSPGADDLMSISKAADAAGVCPNTLRRWDARGLIVPYTRTPGGQRRYKRSQIHQMRRAAQPADTLYLLATAEQAELSELAHQAHEQGWQPEFLVVEIDWRKLDARERTRNLVRLLATGRFRRVMLFDTDKTPFDVRDIHAMCESLDIEVVEQQKSAAPKKEAM
jgi:DNA-binding transcriptional MerR regulator